MSTFSFAFEQALASLNSEPKIRSEPDSAINEYTSALRLEPLDADASYRLGWLFYLRRAQSNWHRGLANELLSTWLLLRPERVPNDAR